MVSRLEGGYFDGKEHSIPVFSSAFGIGKWESDEHVCCVFVVSFYSIQ